MRRSLTPSTSFILCSTRMIVRSARETYDKFHHVTRLLRAHAGGRFVEQQKLRLARQRNADLEGALLAMREPARGPVAPVGEAYASRIWSAFSISVFIAARGHMSKVVTSAWAASRTFSCAESCGNTVVIWKTTMPMCAKRCCGRPVMFRPSNSITPLEGPARRTAG